MIINDGLLQLISEEIEKYQYSNVILLTYLIFSCSNFAVGTIEDNKILLNLGIIYKVMDITIFYIDDKLDSEIISLLFKCLSFLIGHINSLDSESKRQIIIYKNSLIIKIFCKVLKLDLEIFTKQKISEKIIIIIKELNVVSEEIADKDKGLKLEKLSLLVKKLQKNYKSVIILFYYDSLSIKEIKDILNISESAVKKRLERARDVLRKGMGEE